MKRALGLIFVTAACIVGFLSIRGTMPFMPIFGSSMEPTLQSGALLMIEPMKPEDVKVGDIIVYNVPSMVRKYYNYPPIVAHRVIEVKTSPSLSFRTRGDNTSSEDPFTIRPMDLRGTVGNQIPYLGLPPLFFQSQQGLIFVIVALALLALFLYSRELSHGGNILHRGIFSPVITETKRTNRTLTRKIEATEQKINSTEQALVKFSAAIELYAQHLSSHTSAIQGLSEASHELKRSAAEQNKLVSYLVNRLEPPGPDVEESTSRAEEAAREIVKTATRPEKAVPEAQKTAPEPELSRHEAEKAFSDLEKLALERAKAAHELQKTMLAKRKRKPEAVKQYHGALKQVPETEKQFPPGCARNRQSLTAEKAPKKYLD